MRNHKRNRETKDSSSKVKGMSHRDKSNKLKVKKENNKNL
jgi:hypothetical protein